jgi:hypothetical protein
MIPIFQDEEDMLQRTFLASFGLGTNNGLRAASVYCQWETW